MTDEKKSAVSKRVVSNARTVGPKITRRRFTKAGVVAPVIMTLGSRPVWGACSLSGALSGNASNQHNERAGTAGYPPEYWANELNYLATIFSLTPMEGASCTPANLTVSVYDVADFPTVSDFFHCEGLSDQDVYHALLGNGVEAQGVAAYLNALMFEGQYGAHPEDVIAFMCSGLMDIAETLQCMNSQSDYTPSVPVPCANNLNCQLGSGNNQQGLTIIAQSKQTDGMCIVFVESPPVAGGTTI